MYIDLLLMSAARRLHWLKLHTCALYTQLHSLTLITIYSHVFLSCCRASTLAKLYPAEENADSDNSSSGCML